MLEGHSYRERMAGNVFESHGLWMRTVSEPADGVEKRLAHVLQLLRGFFKIETLCAAISATALQAID